MQNELDLQREVSQQFSHNADIVRAEFNKDLDALNEKIKTEKDPEKQKEYEQQRDKLQQRQVFFNMVVAALSAPTDSAAGIAAATAAPAISYGIGQEFKKHNKEGSATHIASHMSLGAVVSALGGNDAVSGALAAGGAEALVPLFSQAIYDTKDPEKLTAEQKQNLSNMARLFGAAVGAATSNGAANGYANVAQGSLNAEMAFDNNAGANIAGRARYTRTNTDSDPLSNYQKRRMLIDGIADFTDPLGLLEPLYAIKNTISDLNQTNAQNERNEQDKINKNLKDYLAKNGINVELETVYELDKTGQGVPRLDTQRNRQKLMRELHNLHESAVTNHASFREAKRRLGIPNSMQPTATRRVPLMENGIQKMGLDGFVIYSTEYLYKINGKYFVIQNHSAGHNFNFNGIGNQPAHFNLKQLELSSHQLNNVNIEKWKSESNIDHNKQTYGISKIPGVIEHLYTTPSRNANPSEPFFKSLTDVYKLNKNRNKK